MKINKNSSIYIALYTIVLVAVVGTALAYTAMSLRQRQQENIAVDKMRQILAALHITPASDSIHSEFERMITDSFIVDSEGKILDGDAFGVDVAEECHLPAVERRLPVYKARIAGASVKYVLPVYGAGLWGPIWGYVALDADGSTVFGAYFDHQGETPGLGAEIAKPAFSGQFDGKHLLSGDKLLPIAVVKRGTRPRSGEWVDGISGGTITSKGVSEMLADCLTPYKAFLLEVNQKYNAR